MTPTAEQQRAIDLFLTGKPLAIEAGAGTGKTATLVMLAQAAPNRRGQYVAFNKAIVTDAAGKMPSNVACNTAHSLAFRAVGRYMKHRLDQPRQRSDETARQMGLTGLTVTTDGKAKAMAPGFLAAKVMRAISIFCQTADLAPTTDHVEYIEGIDLPNATTGRRTYSNNDRVRAHIRPFLAAAWKDLMSPNGTLPYKHEHYLKAWQLSDPKIDADFILFDEAQDANPVMLAAVAVQKQAQLVFVGDSQQQIYEFTGAINAMADLPTESKAFLSQSFRFGGAIAEQANVVLDRLAAELRLTGLDSIPSTVEAVPEPKALLTRTNATAVRYLLNNLADGRKANLVGGGTEVINFAKAAIDLQAGRGTIHPELAMFTSWAEVVSYATDEEEGADLLLLVKLIEEFTAEAILQALQAMPLQKDADIVISTAHKAKGLEWDTVQLAEDFNTFLTGKHDDKEPQPSELRLLYVALTRARVTLDITAIRLLTQAEAAEEAHFADWLGRHGDGGTLAGHHVGLDVTEDDAALAIATGTPITPQYVNPRYLEPISSVDGLSVVGEKLRAQGWEATQVTKAAQSRSKADEQVPIPSTHKALKPVASGLVPCPDCKYLRGHASECSHRAAYYQALLHGGPA